MKLIITLMSCLLAAFNFRFVSSAAAAAPLSIYPLPYPVAEGVFSGEINGVEYNITGTGNSVLSELRRRHPEVDFDARAAASENSTAIEGLEKRNKIWPPVCFERGNRWETTRKPWVDTLVNWGRAVGGTIGVPARRCAFLHCLFDARLYVCNDRDENINPGLAYMVSYAEDICNYKPCQYWSVPKGLNCGGQFFDSDDYNVIVRRSLSDERCL